MTRQTPTKPRDFTAVKNIATPVDTPAVALACKVQLLAIYAEVCSDGLRMTAPLRIAETLPSAEQERACRSGFFMALSSDVIEWATENITDEEFLATFSELKLRMEGV